MRGRDASSFISASAFNLPKRFPGVAALEGKVVLVHKLQVVANKKDFLRFGPLGARFKDISSLTLMPEDASIPTDVPPLIVDPSVDKDLKRERSASAPSVTASQTRIHVCPMMCRRPDSFICAKTGEPHTISVCEFCGDGYDPLEP